MRSNNKPRRSKRGKRMTLGKKIQSLRKAAGMTQEDLAAKTGVRAQQVSEWELDKKYPPLARTVSIVRSFGLTVDEFLSDVIIPARGRRRRMDVFAALAGLIALALVNIPGNHIDHVAEL